MHTAGSTKFVMDQTSDTACEQVNVQKRKWRPKKPVLKKKTNKKTKKAMLKKNKASKPC